MTVTADTTKYTADAHYPTADGYVPANVISAAVIEAAAAADVLDAVRIPAAGAGFWVDRIRPRRVVGVGFGILPPVRGHAHGVVGAVGNGDITLPISGAAMGEVDDGLDELIMMLLLAA